VKIHLSAVILLLTACTQSTDYLNDYLARLETVLDRDVSVIAGVVKLADPSPQQLELDVSAKAKRGY